MDTEIRNKADDKTRKQAYFADERIQIPNDYDVNIQSKILKNALKISINSIYLESSY